MTQFEFYKSFQFVIELLLAEAMFVFRFRRRRFFWLLLPAVQTTGRAVTGVGSWAAGQSG